MRAFLDLEPVHIVGGHRAHRPGPACLSLTVSVPLTEDDLVAALYSFYDAELPLTDLNNVEYVRYLVATAVVNDGADAVATYRAEIAVLPPNDDRRAWLTACRRAVAAIFTTGATAPATIDVAAAVGEPAPACLTAAEETAALYVSGYVPGDERQHGQAFIADLVQNSLTELGRADLGRLADELVYRQCDSNSRMDQTRLRACRAALANTNPTVPCDVPVSTRVLAEVTAR